MWISGKDIFGQSADYKKMSDLYLTGKYCRGYGVFMTSDSFYTAKKNALKKFYSNLNEMQQKAVFSINGPLLVLAGAGSGKTTVIINRIYNMITFGNAFYDRSEPGSEEEKAFLDDYAGGRTDDSDTLRRIVACDTVKPWNILAITFTNKAANELKDRLFAMLDKEAGNIQASTFHSVCLKILRCEIDSLGYGKDFAIYDSDDSQRMIKNIMKEANILDTRFVPRDVLRAISAAKNRMITPEDMLRDANDDFRDKVIAQIYSVYQRKMKESNALDFDDLILLTVEIFEKFPDILKKYRNKYKYILVDEYQDTNNVQFRFVSMLSRLSGNLCVVGDDDQSIYRFRGANIGNILNFEQNFDKTEVVRLEQNYRSTRTILDAANCIIKKNTNRNPKNLWTSGEKGEKIFYYEAYDERDEADFIARKITEIHRNKGKYSDCAVLYRLNAMSNSIEKSLITHKIPYVVYDGMKFYERKEIKDVIAYLSFLNNPYDTIRFERIINEPKRGIGAATVALIEQISEDLKMSPLDVMRNCADYPILSKRSSALRETALMFDELIDLTEELPLTDLLDEVLDLTGYSDYLDSLGEEGTTRRNNIDELRSTMLQYTESAEEPSLEGFLEEIALYTDADGVDSGADKVMVMTIHSAKGLEFENVFVAGMDENVFPSSLSSGSEEGIEEERRLAYVAVTRAKKRLFLSHAGRRMLFGKTGSNYESRFIAEIDEDLLETGERPDENGYTVPKSDYLGEILGEKHRQTVKTGNGKNIVFTKGDTVNHKIFGKGIVISVTERRNNTELEVIFDKVGTKRLMSDFVNKVIKE